MPPPSSIASTPVRVAVVEDDAACRTALAHALQGASDMRLAWTASSRTEAMAALAQDDAAPLAVETVTKTTITPAAAPALAEDGELPADQRVKR